MVDYTYRDIAKLIDHSLLQPFMTDDQLADGYQLAVRYDVASVCTKPYDLARCTEALAGSDVKPTTTIGFPHGGHTTAIKVREAERALADGAVELDTVVNVGKVLSGDWTFVHDDLEAMIEVAHAQHAKVKVIFENAYLQDKHKIQLCELCSKLGADWVKTSTGYAPGGATMEDLRLMIQHVHPPVQVKAAGGVRDLDAVLAVRELGVTRIGASRTAEILDDCRQRLDAAAEESEG